MSFAMSPGYTKHNARPPVGSLMRSASAREPITIYAVERSERFTAATQALHRRAAARTWLPLRTSRGTMARTESRRCC
jgi:hypothetical protein